MISPRLSPRFGKNRNRFVLVPFISIQNSLFIKTTWMKGTFSSDNVWTGTPHDLFDGKKTLFLAKIFTKVKAQSSFQQQAVGNTWRFRGKRGEFIRFHGDFHGELVGFDGGFNGWFEHETSWKNGALIMNVPNSHFFGYDGYGVFPNGLVLYPILRNTLKCGRCLTNLIFRFGSKNCGNAGIQSMINHFT